LALTHISSPAEVSAGMHLGTKAWVGEVAESSGRAGWHLPEVLQLTQPEGWQNADPGNGEGYQPST